MASSEKFSLRWNDFETNLSGALHEIRTENEFFDVTLACEDEQIEAHKVLLSACSPWFRSALKRNPHQHPLFYLKGVKHNQMVSLLDFMYKGEVSVPHEDLNSFLDVAQELQIKGLTQNNSDNITNHMPSSTKTINADQSNSETIAQNQHHNFNKNPLSSSDNKDDIDIQEIVTVKNEINPEDTGGHGALVSVDDNYVEYDQEFVNYGNIVLEDEEKEMQKYDEILNNMVRKIENEPNYGHGYVWQCTVCEKTFGRNYRTNLKSHIESHHMEHIEFSCCLCRKLCKTKRGFKEHCKIYHKEKIDLKEKVPFQLTGL